MDYLYGGNILKIDLSIQRIDKVPTSTYAENYIGGRGINARLIYEGLGPEIKPFDPENIITFGVGPLTGTFFPGSSRIDVMSKSPVTNLLGNANMGGDWAAEFKYAGYDNLYITGKAETPVYINIENDRVELKDATHLWGRDTYKTQAMIREELGDPEVKIISIGPAGENLVTFASVLTKLGNSGSRTGMGAVLGSKNVKAIAVRGMKGVKLADPNNFFEICREVHSAIKNAEGYEEISTNGITKGEYAYVLSGIEAGGDAHKTAPNFDMEGKTDFTKFWKNYGYGRTGCFGCPVHCMENYYIEGIGATVLSCELYPQLTWEVRNDDMMLWYECVRLCQLNAIDNTSISIILAWLMEMYEQGIITEKETDGIAMEWGSRDAILGMIQKTINRDGFGDTLAGGIDVTAEKLDAAIPVEKRKGKSTKYFAMQVNNNPMYGINPRFYGLGLAYAIGRRSDCIADCDIPGFWIGTFPGTPGASDEEIKEWTEDTMKLAEKISGIKNAGDQYSTDGKAALANDFGINAGIVDMVGTCKLHIEFEIGAVTHTHIAKALTAGLGKEITTDDLAYYSLKYRNMERAYECIEGRNRAKDTIPDKEFNNPVSRGAHKGLTLSREQLEKMKDDYYALRGWDITTGVPTEGTLNKFGLEDVAENLKKRGLLPSSTKTPK